MTPAQIKLTQLLSEYLQCVSLDGRAVRQQMRKDLLEQLRVVSAEDVAPVPKSIIFLPARCNPYEFDEGGGHMCSGTEYHPDGTYMAAEEVIAAVEQAGCAAKVAISLQRQPIYKRPE